MPRKGAVDAPRFSGSPDNLLRYLEDVQECCMQASCFKDHGWAQWAIWYLGTDKFKQWRRRPAVWHSKHDLYDLIDEQKTVKINSYETLLDYWLHFTKVAAHLQATSQLLSIKKDDLFLEGVQELKATRAEEQCQGMERCSKKLGLKASQSPGFTALKIQSLTHSLQDSLKLLKVPGESSRSHTLEVDGIEVAMAELSSLPLVEDEQPIEAVALTLKVPKPTPEPRDDLCEVPEQAGHTKVEEIKLEVKVERQSKVVAWRKPPEGWTWSLGVEMHATSPSALSQPAKQSGATTLHVNDAHSLTPHTCSDAAMKIYAGLSYKSENYLFEGYEILGGKVKAPHSGGWSTILKPTVVSGTRKLTEEATLRVRTPQAIWSATSKCPKVFKESNKHETPSRLVCLLQWVLSVSSRRHSLEW
ncbi:hypothetical protein F5141DRAFT_1065872 [Pisolithus sp. B1]|nr:hypothetical protein F5141DRAFT_1065872 [Pisolithus sp. B1]